MKTAAEMPVMILCGGKGTRLREVTELLPKPLVPIGNFPIVWHIMRSFSAFGVKRFILCLGYKRNAFAEYFLNFRAMKSDITLKMNESGNSIIFHDAFPEDGWEITLADTGISAKTADRLVAASKYLRDDDDEFFMTYGDGVANIDVAALLECHRNSGKDVTLSAVHPEGRFGEINFSGKNIFFEEKPFRLQGYINGGYMVMKRDALKKYTAPGQSEFFEAEPMRRITDAHQLNAYRHEGFWQCMDTPREHEFLNSLWENGNAPWTEYWSK